jgi:fructose-specific phosphotransferase system IIC component
MVAKNVRFCDSEESINHLFFHCPFAKLIWRTIQFTFNIPPLANVTNMFGNWLNGVDKKNKNNVRIGICSLMLAIWNCRNDVVFNKRPNANFL